MKTNHLNTANKYIEKQIGKLQIEKDELLAKAAALIGKADIVDKQIQSLQETQKSLGVEKPVEKTVEV